MQPSLSFFHSPDKVYHLCHALYGLKQASQAWFAKFSSTVSHVGYSTNSYDFALFFRHANKGTILLLLYVNDMIIIAMTSVSLKNSNIFSIDLK